MADVLGQEQGVNRTQQKDAARHPARTWMIRCGGSLAALSGLYLMVGMIGIMPLEPVEIAWNNVRIVAGATIAGCLMAAVGYGDE
jgi:hypothetical protein